MTVRENHLLFDWRRGKERWERLREVLVRPLIHGTVHVYVHKHVRDAA